MEKFFYKLLGKRKIVYIVVLILCAISAQVKNFVGINYDMSKTLPKDCVSRVGDTFVVNHYGKNTTGILMIEDFNIKEADKLVKDVEKVEGVKDVTWLGTMADTSIPVEFIDSNIKNQFIKDNNMMVLVAFEGAPSDLATREGIKQINKILPENVIFGGEPVITEYLNTSNTEGSTKTMIIAVIVILVILGLATTSIIEPLLFLVAIGISIVINQGTNIFIGEISFLTSSIATVIQLGISMDYAIMVVHRLEEEKEHEKDIRKAISKTLSITISAVASSAATTIIGFLVLMLMINKIGLDLGFVLAKGIVISLMSIVVVLPCLIMSFNNVIEKTKHKVYLPKFKKIGKYIVKIPYVFIIVLIPLGFISLNAQQKIEYYYAFENFLYKDSPPIVSTDKILNVMDKGTSIDIVIPDKGEAFEKSVKQELENIKDVKKVTTITDITGGAIPSNFTPENVKDMYISDGYRKMTLELDTPVDDSKTFEAINQIESELKRKVGSDFYLFGSAVTSRDSADIAYKDSLIVNIVSVLAIALVLLLTFKSATLPIILVMVIEFSIWINLGLAYFTNQSIASLSTIFLGAIQLGATVDYAILFTSRYLENRVEIDSKYESVIQTIKGSGISIFTSGIILISATLAISLVTDIKTSAEITMLIARGTMISMIMIFTLLPSLFLVLDKLIIKTTKALKPILSKSDSTNHIIKED